MPITVTWISMHFGMMGFCTDNGCPLDDRHLDLVQRDYLFRLQMGMLRRNATTVRC